MEERSAKNDGGEKKSGRWRSLRANPPPPSIHPHPPPPPYSHTHTHTPTHRTFRLNLSPCINYLGGGGGESGRVRGEFPGRSYLNSLHFVHWGLQGWRGVNHHTQLKRLLRHSRLQPSFTMYTHAFKTDSNSNQILQNLTLINSLRTS